MSDRPRYRINPSDAVLELAKAIYEYRVLVTGQASKQECVLEACDRYKIGLSDQMNGKVLAGWKR